MNRAALFLVGFVSPLIGLYWTVLSGGAEVELEPYLLHTFLSLVIVLSVYLLIDILVEYATTVRFNDEWEDRS